MIEVLLRANDGVAKDLQQQGHCHGKEEEVDEAGDLQVAQGKEGSRASRVEVDEGARASHGMAFLMPFKSKAQQRFMFATMPKTAKKWAKKTKNIKRLPARVKKKKGGRK